MNDQEVTTAELLSFMQEHVVLKGDLEHFATKEDLIASESRVLTATT